MDQNTNIDLEQALKQQRRKSLEKKFFSQVEKKYMIVEEDIWEIIEKLKLQKNFDKEASRKIFEDLDKNKTGQIKIDEFLDYVNEKLKEKQTQFQPFYEHIMEELVGLSEKIIFKLKKLKQKAFVHNDLESLDDIDWIITCLCESDINEPDYLTMNKITQTAQNNKDFSQLGVEYISQYSQFLDKERKVKDIMSVNAKIGERGHFQSSDENEKSYQHELSDSILDSVKKNLETIDNLDYNIFELNELVETHSMTLMSVEIFSRMDFFSQKILNEERVKKFVTEITKGYDRNVTYHNDLHAADVLQTSFAIVRKSASLKKLNLQQIDILSLLVSSIIHDYKHPGLNNIYHINAKSKLAVRYNDKSVLESHHVAQAFKIILKPEYNIFENLSPEEFRLVRRRMIECIMSTDMANHNKVLAALKSKIETFDIKAGKNVERMVFSDNVEKTFENQQTVLNMIIHSSDISNPAKPTHIQKTWVDLIFIEFFKQGDLEKSQGLPVSLLCDRSTTNIDKSQIGFMNFVVIPTFDTLILTLPELSFYMDTMKANLKKYEELSKQNK